jgi:hypothetical protein
MTIPHLESLAAYGRRMHRSTCTIERAVDGQGPFDPDTGEHNPAPPDVIYTGSCQVAPTGGARVVEFGEGPTTLNVYDVELAGPVDGIQVGDVVRFGQSPDPQVAAAVGVVLETILKDTVTNRRLMVEVQR